MLLKNVGLIESSCCFEQYPFLSLPKFLVLSDLCTMVGETYLLVSWSYMEGSYSFRVCTFMIEHMGIYGGSLTL